MSTDQGPGMMPGCRDCAAQIKHSMCTHDCSVCGTPMPLDHACMWGDGKPFCMRCGYARREEKPVTRTQEIEAYVATQPRAEIDKRNLDDMHVRVGGKTVASWNSHLDHMPDANQNGAEFIIAKIKAAVESLVPALIGTWRVNQCQNDKRFGEPFMVTGMSAGPGTGARICIQYADGHESTIRQEMLDLLTRVATTYEVLKAKYKDQLAYLSVSDDGEVTTAFFAHGKENALVQSDKMSLAEMIATLDKVLAKGVQRPNVGSELILEVAQADMEAFPDARWLWEGHGASLNPRGSYRIIHGNWCYWDETNQAWTTAPYKDFVGGQWVRLQDNDDDPVTLPVDATQDATPEFWGRTKAALQVLHGAITPREAAELIEELHNKLEAVTNDRDFARRMWEGCSSMLAHANADREALHAKIYKEIEALKEQPLEAVRAELHELREQYEALAAALNIDRVHGWWATFNAMLGSPALQMLASEYKITGSVMSLNEVVVALRKSATRVANEMHGDRGLDFWSGSSVVLNDEDTVDTVTKFVGRAEVGGGVSVPTFDYEAFRAAGFMVTRGPATKGGGK